MTGLFTLFYRGLLELSKSFLDPFGNRRVSFTGLSAEVNVDCMSARLEPAALHGSNPRQLPRWLLLLLLLFGCGGLVGCCSVVAGDRPRARQA
jgi:hypothetical protein